MTKQFIIVLFSCFYMAGLQAQSPTPITLQDALSLFPDAKSRCGETALVQMRRLTDPGFQERRDRIDALTRDWISAHEGQRSTGVVNIPVVVHVLYANAQQNVTDAQVQSQIDVLNKDFRHLNTDTSNTPTAFSALAADAGIEFCLASLDPSGNPSTGITRTSTSVAEIGNGAYYSSSQGGKDGWNPNQYLNIWVCEITGYGDILGFAWPPGTSSAAEDGAVIDYRFFGTMGTVSSPFDLGRTTTHEIGHYLNLEHIWGEYGGCGDDDGVSDTPSQSQEYYGCPSHPSSSCNSEDMFMNFMDYSDDACMNMFSTGQAQRMMATLNGPRAGLLSGSACGNTVAIDAGPDLENDFQVYPNPARSMTRLGFKFDQSQNVELYVYNILGARMMTLRFENVQRQEIELNLSDLSAGVYLLELRSGNKKAVKKLVVQ